MIGQQIKEYRKLRGISAQELADRTGVLTRAVIANLESLRKDDVTITELLALSRALDVSPASLDPRLSDVSDQWRHGYQQAVRDMQVRLLELG